MSEVRSSSNYTLILGYIIIFTICVYGIREAASSGTVWDILICLVFILGPIIPILKRFGRFKLTDEGITRYTLWGKVFFPWSEIRFISMTYWSTRGYCTDCAVICTQPIPYRISYRKAIALRNRKTMMAFALDRVNGPCSSQVPTVDKEAFLQLAALHNVVVFPCYGESI